MRASTENLVEVLNDYGFLHLNGESPWGELDNGDDAFPHDHAAEARGDDLEPDEPDAAPAERIPADDSGAAGRARERRYNDLNSIAERLGGGAPPDLPDPDALAWYQPIHYFAGQWGVFVKESSITELARAMAGFVLTSRDPLRVASECQRMAHVALRLHETFHHKVESASIRLEVITRSEKFDPYHRNVFRPLREAQSDDLLEEALATAWMYRNRNSDRRGVGDDVLVGLKAFLETWIVELPYAYGRGVALSPPNEFDPTLYDLTSQLDEAATDPSRWMEEWATVTHLHDPMQNRLSNHYIVVALGEVPYLPTSGHESRELSVSSDELVRMLTKLGWKTDSSRRGRHPLKMVRDGSAPIPVPVGREALAVGTLKSIAKQAGYANERELVAAVRR